MLAPGQSTEIQGSGSKPYVIKNHDGIVWSCTCPGWRNCKGAVNTKTCKHIRQINGAANEAARIGQAAAPAATPASATTSQGKATATPRQAAPTATGQTAATRQRIPGLWYPFTESEKAHILGRKEQELGRKLRQDEKTDLFGPPVLLAHGWDGSADLTGWWISTKYDGVRAYFDEKQLISRQGNIFPAPQWFLSQLGSEPLDGELYLGRGRFQETTSLISQPEGWKQLKFMVFDAPAVVGSFEQRQAAIASMKLGISVHVAQQILCTGVAHIKQALLAEEALGGEGVMLRQPGSAYETRRSSTLLKVKTFFDAEATVIGYKDGKNSNKGLVGALECVVPEHVTLQIGGKSCTLKKGTTFHVGSGLTANHRRNPPKIGSIITFRFLELTKDGVPRNGSFVAIRDYE
jgi:DNA ligase 1